MSLAEALKKQGIVNDKPLSKEDVISDKSILKSLDHYLTVINPRIRISKSGDIFIDSQRSLPSEIETYFQKSNMIAFLLFKSEIDKLNMGDYSGYPEISSTNKIDNDHLKLLPLAICYRIKLAINERNGPIYEQARKLAETC
ncbi:hypothetical protein PQU92_17260 [Asticcacaulis sp. BYS171W]|uniref:Uncharacterized protein n=1 Tax=Asticcacaulis aquaticus TaxID=2984212 RepID=A0ABT5HY71_9CAUL|nr:hypothetical protein [Asticcacaulis aquaticus]MDC7685036.1 hypothetical protein [Asticcacaulis aquaticus]